MAPPRRGRTQSCAGKPGGQASRPEPLQLVAAAEAERQFRPVEDRLHLREPSGRRRRPYGLPRYVVASRATPGLHRET